MSSDLSEISVSSVLKCKKRCLRHEVEHMPKKSLNDAKEQWRCSFSVIESLVQFFLAASLYLLYPVLILHCQLIKDKTLLQVE